jgi:hypothetical protein
MNKNELLLTGSGSFFVPEKMLYITKKGNESVINTLTKTGRISSRDKKPIIRFDKIKDNYLSINKPGYSKKSIKKYLADQAQDKITDRFSTYTSHLEISKLENKLKRLRDKKKIKETKEKIKEIEDYNEKVKQSYISPTNKYDKLHERMHEIASRHKFVDDFIFL